jgi:citrate lyase subunit beta/citryl-CoA lyase
VPLIETAVGVSAAHEIAAATTNILALAFGAADYAADLDLPPQADDVLQYLVPRGTVVLAARVANLAGAIDSASGLIDDLTGLRADSRAAAALGFRGKLAIHPMQIRTISRAFEPGPEAIDKAGRICSAFDAAIANGHAAIQVDGAFVDYPIANRARSLLTRTALPRDVGKGPT